MQPEAASIDSKQAEAITNAVCNAVMEGTATKGDILRIDNDVNTGFASLNGKIDALAKDTKADIARLEVRVTTTTLVVAGIVIAAIKYLIIGLRRKSFRRVRACVPGFQRAVRQLDRTSLSLATLGRAFRVR